MGKRKLRIEIKVVGPDSTWEFDIVEGREMANGQPAPPPTKKQFDMAYKAIRMLSEVK